jgi:hypothetical protein
VLCVCHSGICIRRARSEPCTLNGMVDDSGRNLISGTSTSAYVRAPRISSRPVATRTSTVIQTLALTDVSLTIRFALVGRIHDVEVVHIELENVVGQSDPELVVAGDEVMKIPSGTRAPIFGQVRHESDMVPEKRNICVLKVNIKCPIPSSVPLQRGWHRSPNLYKQNCIGQVLDVHCVFQTSLP